jgi:hypothetical protein
VAGLLGPLTACAEAARGVVATHSLLAPPILLGLAPHCRGVRVLHLEPIGRGHDGSTSKAEALDRAEGLRSTFAELANLSHRAAARALNERGLRTAEGSEWSAVQVMRVRRRLGL